MSVAARASVSASGGQGPSLSATGLTIQPPQRPARHGLRSLLASIFALAQVGFNSYLAYPAGVVFVFLSYPIIIVMYRYVYGAVYASGASIGGMDMQGAITYVTISWSLNTFYMTPTGRNLGAAVREGQVAMDLLKPLNLMANYLGQGIGRTFFRLCFATLPLLLVFNLFGDIKPPSAAAVLPFFLAIVLGYSINFILDYSIGLLSFYLEYNNGIRMGIRMVMNIAGGMVIPLSQFPEGVERAFKLLPTQHMFYQPMQIYLGHISGAEAWLMVLRALVWVVLLGLGAQLLQRGGMKRLAISGG
ncbi:ABC-2 family transporter protein [bacterium]|nr:ABC-2 family transporter protein [bacterium]